jgi:hypothetical protein
LHKKLIDGGKKVKKLSEKIVQNNANLFIEKEKFGGKIGLFEGQKTINWQYRRRMMMNHCENQQQQKHSKRQEKQRRMMASLTMLKRGHLDGGK